MKIELINMKPENTNSVLVSYGNDAVIFDPYGTADDWNDFLSGRGLNLRAIYATHGHYDHITAVENLNAHWYMNHNDLAVLPWSNMMLEEKISRPSNDLQPGEIEIFDGKKINGIHTPGHSAGGMIFHFPENKVLVVGDTIFSNAVGRWDLPTGNLNELKKSIAKISDMNLPNDTIVIPGHGEITTIERLKSENEWFKNNAL